MLGLVTDDGFERSRFPDHVKFVKFMTDAQVHCAIAEYRATPKKSGDRFEVSRACAEAK